MSETLKEIGDRNRKLSRAQSMTNSLVEANAELDRIVHRLRGLPNAVSEAYRSASDARARGGRALEEISKHHRTLRRKHERLRTWGF